MRRRNRHTLIIAALAGAALLPIGCKRNEQPPRAQTIEEEPPGLATIVHVADPRASLQLIKGFHEVEQNAWRWTMGKFAVTLRPPRNAATRGAALQLKFSIPEALIERLKSVTLSARAGTHDLAPETYTQAGEFVYSRDVPGDILAGEAVTVEFALDKYLPVGAVDQRELGVVVSTIGFEAK